MNVRDQRADMMTDLFAAVLRGDCAAAEQALVQMEWCGLHAEPIRRARQKVRPIPSSRLAEPDVFPRPGARPGDFDCDPALKRRAFGAIAPRARPRKRRA